MKFKVTSITIDWNDAFDDYHDPVPQAEKDSTIKSIMETTWDALDDDYGCDLVNQICDAYGWRIEDIDYKPTHS